MQLGYVKLYRQCMENAFYFSERFTKWQAFCDLLLLATFKRKVVYIRNVKVILEPGDLCWSQKSLAERWKWNRRTVKKYLQDLENEEMIRTKTTNITTVIRIVKWEEYNGITQQDTQRNTQQEA